MAESERDDDHPTVANLESVVFNGGFDWLVSVFGPSLVVLAADTPLTAEPGPIGELAKAPVANVLDAIECLMDADAAAFKRLPDSLDAGHAWVSGPYVGESLQRVRNGDTWQDTNDSGADFTIGTPDPSFVVASEGIYGEPWIELGTGHTTFTPITNGDNIELVAGIQGGWHIDASLRFGGFGPDGIVVVYQAVDEQAQTISFTTQATLSRGSVLEDGEGEWLRVGDRVVLDIPASDEIVGTTAIMRVTAELDGQTWSDERTVVIVDESP